MEDSDLFISKNIQRTYDRVKRNNNKFYHTTREVRFDESGTLVNVTPSEESAAAQAAAFHEDTTGLTLSQATDCDVNDHKLTRRFILSIVCVESLMTSLLLILNYIINVKGRRYVFLQIYTVLIGALGTYLTFMNRLT